MEEETKGFTLVAECLAVDTIPVKKYRSPRTGLNVIVADIPGPLVHGYFIVATEALDDDGLPHTLEHLIFLGSADYPYKGTLDISANRCLASGTNAWTETDHTAYTVSTAGSEGFLNLLPIYLDHLFFPTLTDAGFTTEVYHITGKGEDSGVVFCEIQTGESSESHTMYMELIRALYKRNSGYRYDTGGAVCNVRYSTNNEKIRKFHNKFYCPLNTTIVVTGSVNVDELLEACCKFEEEKLLMKCSKAYEKAWKSPVELLKKSVIRAITYPSDQEDNGCVTVGWQGPSIVNEYYKFIACTILLKYLSETAASPLMKYFVEISEPYCSDINVIETQYSVPILGIEYENVVINKIPFIHEKLMELLGIIVSDKNELYQITKTRINSVIEKYKLENLLKFEKNPEKNIAMGVICDTLYGQSAEDITDKLNVQKLASRLLDEPISFWITLLNDQFLRKPSVTILGYPWKNQEILHTELENERLSYREATLGKDGLKKKADILEAAIQKNNILPPNELIATVPIPRIGEFKYHSLKRYTTTSKEQHPDFNLSSSIFFTQLDDLNSNFVYAYIIMDGRKLSTKLRLYLSLFLEYILECPINRKGQFIPHEQIAAELEQDLVSIESSIGLLCNDKFTSGPYSYSVSLNLVMTQENYEKGLTWIRSLLYDSVFTLERLQITVQKIISSISQIRRQGFAMVKCLSKLMQFNSENHRMNTVLAQLQFLKELSKRLENPEEFKLVIMDLETIRSVFADSDNIILHLSTNVGELSKKIRDPAQILSQILPKKATAVQNRFTIQQDYEILSSAMLGQDNDIKSCVIGMATEDSSFMQHATKSINNFDHPDIPAVLVYINYLTQLEGPLWRIVRGFGFAYHYNIILQPNEGILFLTLYLCSDVVEAFKKTKEVVEESLKSTDNWNNLLFESGKSSLIFKIVDLERNIRNVSRQSLLSHFYNTPGDYNKLLIRKIQSVNMSQMKAVGEKYIAPLFDPKKSLSTVVCHSSKCENIASRFAEMGHELTVFSSLEDSYLNPSFIARISDMS